MLNYKYDGDLSVIWFILFTKLFLMLISSSECRFWSVNQVWAHYGSEILFAMLFWGLYSERHWNSGHPVIKLLCEEFWNKLSVLQYVRIEKPLRKGLKWAAIGYVNMYKIYSVQNASSDPEKLNQHCAALGIRKTLLLYGRKCGPALGWILLRHKFSLFSDELSLEL